MLDKPRPGGLNLQVKRNTLDLEQGRRGGWMLNRLPHHMLLVLLTIILSACSTQAETFAPEVEQENHSDSQPATASAGLKPTTYSYLGLFDPIESTVSPAAEPREAAELIWKSIKDDSSPRIVSPDVNAIPGSDDPVTSPVLARSTMRVLQVIPVCEFDMTSRGTWVWDYLKPLNDYTVLVGSDTSVAMFTIGRPDGRWLYAPNSFGTPGSMYSAISEIGGLEADSAVDLKLIYVVNGEGSSHVLIREDEQAILIPYGDESDLAIGRPEAAASLLNRENGFAIDGP